MVKEYTKGFISDNDGGDLYAYDILSGGITPVRQPIDKLIGKVFNWVTINRNMITI